LQVVKRKIQLRTVFLLGSMYVFIEFGRLGCKHVIYIGDVYVLSLSLMCAYTHTGVRFDTHMHNLCHFGSSISCLAF